MLRSVTRLEQAIRLWENRYVCEAAANRVARQPNVQAHYNALPLVGPLLHAASFRQYLLQAFHDRKPFDTARYLGNETIVKAVGALAELPWFLWQWNYVSRRVYQITQDLQLLLGVTSLEDVTWKDIHLPFPCFGIALVDPIVDESNGRKFDFLLVSLAKHEGNKKWFYNLILFPQDLERYEPLTEKEKRTMEKAAGHKDWMRILSILNRYQKRCQNLSLMRINYSFEGGQERTVEDVRTTTGDTDYSGDALSVFRKAARIIFGVCLYLKSLPSNHSAIQEEKKVKPEEEKVSSPDKFCISDIADICTVSSTHTLTDEERHVLTTCRDGAGGYEVRAHFRTGHWRRPPGLGQDPNAERTIWVRPTLVRRDRVAAGTVPGGAEAHI